jgi:hypothetical protein
MTEITPIATPATEAKAKKKADPVDEKKNRLFSLRERAIALRDAGKLAPVAVVEYFAAGEDSNFDEIEAKLDAFAEEAAE